MPTGKDGGDLPRERETKRPIKVLICDASSVVRRGLAQMLAIDDEILVVAEASSVEHVVAVAEGAGAAVVIGDPHQLGAEAIVGLLAAGAKVLVVSFTVEERHLMQAIACGCSGYVDQREARPEDLPRFVRLAADGHRVFSDGAFELLRRYLRQNAAVAKGLDLGVPLGRRLSSRERQVLGHLIRGRTNKTIAKLLGVSESTVKTFVTRMNADLREARGPHPPRPA